MEPKIDVNRFDWELNVIAEKPVKPDCTMFYGSSTFAIWKDIEKIFARYNAINCGFGGSVAHEGLVHYERIAKRLAPKVLLWYFGDNDPVCCYTFEETVSVYKQTWEQFRKDFPNIKIISVGTKTSPARDEYAEYVCQLNAWQKDFAKENSAWFTFIDTADICKKDGRYILENYLEDQLHFGAEGYKILEQKIKAELERCY